MRQNILRQGPSRNKCVERSESQLPGMLCASESLALGWLAHLKGVILIFIVLMEAKILAPCWIGRSQQSPCTSLSCPVLGEIWSDFLKGKALQQCLLHGIHRAIRIKGLVHLIWAQRLVHWNYCLSALTRQQRSKLAVGSSLESWCGNLVPGLILSVWGAVADTWRTQESWPQWTELPETVQKHLAVECFSTSALLMSWAE